MSVCAISVRSGQATVSRKRGAYGQVAASSSFETKLKERRYRQDMVSIAAALQPALPLLIVGGGEVVAVGSDDKLFNLI